MADTTEYPKFRRAADFVAGIGESIEQVQGRDVLVRDFDVQRDRPMKGKPATIVVMKISELDNLEEVTLYHAWSGPLADKFEEIPDDAWPLVVKFKKTGTSSGNRVWTFE